MPEKKPTSTKVLIDPDEPHAWLKFILKFNHPYKFRKPISYFTYNQRETEILKRYDILTAGDMLAYIYSLEAGSRRPPQGMSHKGWRDIHEKIRTYFHLDELTHVTLRNGSILSSKASERIKEWMRYCMISLTSYNSYMRNKYTFIKPSKTKKDPSK